MTEDKRCSVLVMSCDKNSDLWDPFFSLINKYWPECQYDFYLVTERKIYQPKNCKVKIINILQCNPNWGSRLLNSLQKIDSELILFLLDDYFLCEKPNSDLIYGIENLMAESKDIDCIYLGPRKDGPFHYKYPEYKRVINGEAYCIAAQPAIWRKKKLSQVTNENHTPWTWEEFGSVSMIWSKDLFLCYPFGLLWPVYPGGVIHRGKWAAGAVEQLKTQFGEEFNLNERGVILWEDIDQQLGLKKKIQYLWTGIKLTKFKMAIFLIRKYFLVRI